ncbi:LLM class flavin-dependent oxidoreductase [Pontimicrobium sp. MEBiC06410]
MTKQPLKIGLLEYGYRIDKNSMATIEEIIEYAVEADKLGFSRFWLGEHHGSLTTMAFTNPDILISIIAGMTDTIKVGSAGSTILMSNTYPVATNYKLMNNLFYDRIDLGLAKGSGLVESRQVVKMDKTLGERENLKEQFDDKLKLICDLLQNEKKNLKENQIVIPPFGGKPPEIWYLSTSYRNFSTAIKYKLNYCRSLFHSSTDENQYKKEDVIKFKQDFFNEHNFYPEINYGISICVGDTMEDAKKEYDKLLEHYGKGENENFIIFPVTIDSLCEMLLGFQERYGIDEFIIYDMTDDPQKMLVNIREISKRFNLQKELKIN